MSVRVKMIEHNMIELHTDRAIILFSYETPVAAYIKDTEGKIKYFVTKQKFSNTTSRHIRKWVGGKAYYLKEQEFFENLLKLKGENDE